MILILSLVLSMDELLVVLVVGAADAVIPLPAVLLVPVAGDQMAEPLVAERGKGEDVAGAALKGSKTPSIDCLVFRRTWHQNKTPASAKSANFERGQADNAT